MRFCHLRTNSISASTSARVEAFQAAGLAITLSGSATNLVFNLVFNLNSAVETRQSSGKLLMLNQCLCLESSTMANPFGKAL